MTKDIADPTYYDFDAYLRGGPEERLRLIYDARKASTEKHQQAFFEGQMMAISVDIVDHPEWMDYGCLCSECLSNF